jgi:hypothetical protein
MSFKIGNMLQKCYITSQCTKVVLLTRKKRKIEKQNRIKTENISKIQILVLRDHISLLIGATGKSHQYNGAANTWSVMV